MFLKRARRWLFAKTSVEYLPSFVVNPLVLVVGKSSLLLKFAALSSQPSVAMLPVFISASSDLGDYLRLAENLLDKFTDALLAVPTMQVLRGALMQEVICRLLQG